METELMPRRWESSPSGVRGTDQRGRGEGQRMWNRGGDRGSGETRSIEAAVTMAPLLACKQCFMPDARFESNVTSGSSSSSSSVRLVESKRNRNGRRRCHRRLPRVRWTAIIEVATSLSRISRTLPETRRGIMDGRDESWSSSCRVVVFLVLVLAVVVVVVVADAARNRAPAVSVCWFVVDVCACKTLSRAWSWATVERDFMRDDAFNSYLTSGNQPEKPVRLFSSLASFFHPLTSPSRSLLLSIPRVLFHVSHFPREFAQFLVASLASSNERPEREERRAHATPEWSAWTRRIRNEPRWFLIVARRITRANLRPLWKLVCFFFVQTSRTAVRTETEIDSTRESGEIVCCIG